MNNMNSHIFLKFDKSIMFMVIAIIVVTSIFIGIFYTVADTPHFYSVNQPNQPYATILVPTFKLVHRNGWHPCAEDPGVFCNGPYAVNETILKNQTLHTQP
jgi:hypothetical protein